MAKATKERTPEEQAKINDRMAKARAARQNKNPKTEKALGAEEILSLGEDIVAQEAPQEQAPIVPEKKDDTIVEPDVGDLMRQIQELKDNQWSMMQQMLKNQAGGAPVTGPSVAHGKLTGTVDKYDMNPALYSDPRERLAKEPKLARFAFSLNYELEWEIGESAYETIDHVRERQPKFTLTLIRIMIDEDTGEDTGGRYDICRLIMHEDPIAALTIARENGIDVDVEDEAAFLNEMRYIRMRDWLLEAFYPSKPTVGKQKRDMVIGGKLVSYWEKNTEADSGDQGIRKTDWDKIPKIKF